MKNRRNGFTLIELIVCIAIIAALGVTVGVGLTQVMRQTRNSKSEEIFKQIFDAAGLYTQMQSFKCGRDESNNCTVSLNTLVNVGLLDKEILEMENPLYSSKKTFATTNDKLILTHDSDGEKIYTYKCGNSKAEIVLSRTSKVEDFTNWGKC